MEGRQLGPLCHLAALRPPPKSAARAAAEDPARQIFLQATLLLSTVMQCIPGKMGKAHSVLLPLEPDKLCMAVKKAIRVCMRGVDSGSCRRRAGALLMACCSCARPRQPM